MDELRVVASKRRVMMMAVLDGCRIVSHGNWMGNHPRRKFKPAACASLCDGIERSYKQYRMCLRKERYRTQGEATRKIGYIRNCRPDAELKSYYCDYCGGWHLSHQMKDVA